MTACEERYFGGEQNVSTNKSTFTTIYNQEILSRNDSANCPLCCSLLFPFQQVNACPRVVIFCTCCSSCFPYISKKAQQGRLLFLKKLPQKVVLCCFPFSRLSESSQVVICCTCCSSCFPYVSKKTQQRLAAFPENAARKSCSLLFPFQQACLTLRLLYVVLVVLVVFPISARRPSKKPQHKVLTNQLTPD